MIWVHGQDERGAFHLSKRPEKPLKMPRVKPVSGSIDVLDDQHEPGIQHLQNRRHVLSLDQRVAGVRRRRRAHIGHASVMPESRNLYKYDILDRRRSGDETR